MPATTGMPISARSAAARRGPWALSAGLFSSASAAASNRRDTSMRAPSASTPGDEATGAVALDFRQLVAIDGEVSASGKAFAAAGERPEHRKDRRTRHERDEKPEQHAPVLVEADGRGQKAIKRRSAEPSVAEQSGVSAARVARSKTQKTRRAGWG